MYLKLKTQQLARQKISEAEDRISEKENRSKAIQREAPEKKNGQKIQKNNYVEHGEKS